MHFHVKIPQVSFNNVWGFELCQSFRPLFGEELQEFDQDLRNAKAEAMW